LILAAGLDAFFPYVFAADVFRFLTLTKPRSSLIPAPSFISCWLFLLGFECWMTLLEAPSPVLARSLGHFIRRGTLAGDTKGEGR
jgi:hypothetical protein